MNLLVLICSLIEAQYSSLFQTSAKIHLHRPAIVIPYLNELFDLWDKQEQKDYITLLSRRIYAFQTLNLMSVSNGIFIRNGYIHLSADFFYDTYHHRTNSVRLLLELNH